MRQKVFTGSLLGLLLAMQAAGATADDTGKGADYFPLTKGSTWKYSTLYSVGIPVVSTVSVKAQAGGKATEYLVENASVVDTITEIYAREKEWVILKSREYKKSKSLNLILRPPKQIMSSGAKVGMRWSWSGPSALAGSTKDSMEIAGVEKVTVPAGKFTCIKVLTIKDIGGMMMTRLDWYARGVGLVKTVIPGGPDRGETQLVSFKINK